MKNFIKNNLEIVIAVVVIVVIASIIIGWDKVSFFKQESLSIDKEELVLLMKNRPEEQRQIFIERIDAAQKMLEEDPSGSSAFEIVGFLYDTLGDKETAKKYYKQVLKLDPESVSVLNNLANIYSGEKKFSNAEELYLRITEVDHTNIEAWRDLHDLYRYLYESKKDEADKILFLGLEKNPADPQLLAMLATYYQDEKEIEKAIEYYERLIEVVPENVAAQNELEKLRKNR